MQATPQQIRESAAAGVELLSNKDLPVPLGITLGGQLGILQAMLTAIAKGDLIVVNSPTPEQMGETQGAKEGAKIPTLESIKGGKQEGDEAG